MIKNYMQELFIGTLSFMFPLGWLRLEKGEAREPSPVKQGHIVKINILSPPLGRLLKSNIRDYIRHICKAYDRGPFWIRPTRVFWGGRGLEWMGWMSGDCTQTLTWDLSLKNHFLFWTVCSSMSLGYFIGFQFICITFWSEYQGASHGMKGWWGSAREATTMLQINRQNPLDAGSMILRSHRWQITDLHDMPSCWHGSLSMDTDSSIGYGLLQFFNLCDFIIVWPR